MLNIGPGISLNSQDLFLLILYSCVMRCISKLKALKVEKTMETR